MSEIYNELTLALKSIGNIAFKPEIAVVLGSGLGMLADKIDVYREIDYRTVAGFPVSTVEGHKGKFVLGELGGKRVIAMAGRVHMYEGYSPQKTVMPIRLMKMLGAERLILTNAAGGINEGFRQGSLMVIRDHISAFVPSPLIGENVSELGVRFPDMSQVYSSDLREKLFATGKALGIDLKEGVYCQLRGPQFETPTEIKMLKALGADAVGMSTVCEAIAARHCGMEVCGISCITNMAAGISKVPLSHSEVQETADRVGKDFVALVSEFVESF